MWYKLSRIVANPHDMHEPAYGTKFVLVSFRSYRMTPFTQTPPSGWTHQHQHIPILSICNCTKSTAFGWHRRKIYIFIFIYKIFLWKNHNRMWSRALSVLLYETDITIFFSFSLILNRIMAIQRCQLFSCVFELGANFSIRTLKISADAVSQFKSANKF